jgi:predicted TIM-barrel fold metal-dependent hydrolase
MNRTPGGLAALVLATLLAAPPSPAQQQAERPPYKTPYKVINVHQHWGAPDADAVQAEIEVMDQVGVAAAVNLDAGRSDGTLPEWIALEKRHPGRLVNFAKFTLKDFERIKDPGFFEELVRELERAAAMGVRGVKMWKDLGMLIRDGGGALLRIDDPRLDPFWAKCGELGLVVFIHSADPREYWYPLTPNSLHYGARTEEQQYYKVPGMPRWEDLIEQRDNVVRKHPKTTFIGAHFGSMTFDLQGLAERLDRFPNFHVECAARLRILGRLNPKAVRDFFVKYQDRILFGTDGSVLTTRRAGTGSKNILVYPVDDPDWVRIDPKDAAAVRRWKEGQVRTYARYFEYFETDRVDLLDPSHFEESWLRLAGAKLPPELLEKFYHANAERLIPGLRAK